METMLFSATLYLAAAVIAVPIAARFGLGSVLGYLLAGIVIGPTLGLVGSETQDLQHFAEFGVVMMLFLIGLELEPRALWNMRGKLIGMGSMQLGLTMGAVFVIAYLLGLQWQTALAVGMIVTLSSTAIVLQTLNEKGLMQSNGGRNAFAVLLAQDIAVIPMLTLMPVLAISTLAAAGGHGDGHHESHAAVEWMQSLPPSLTALVTLGVMAGIIFAGHFLTRPIFRFVHMAKLREMYTAVSLLFVVGVASLMLLVGLSPALGAFLAGVVLANSEFRHEIEADIEPFKGLLLGLFFITVGAGMDFNLLLSEPIQLIAITAGIIAIKGLILWVIARLYKIEGSDGWLFTLSLAQAGEFGFVLVAFAMQQHVLPAALGQTLFLAIALSMLATPALFILHSFLDRALSKSPQRTEADLVDEQHPVIIAGIGRFGQVVNRMAQMARVKTVVLDNDLKTIELMRRFGFKGFFGDPSRPELLHAAGLKKAKVLVVAVDSRHEATQIVQYARKECPDLHIIARAIDRTHVYELYQAGADDIIRELFDSSLRAGRYVLENMGFSEFEAHEAERTFYRHDRQSLRDLAQLWDPAVELDKNEAYVARARELNNELETALADRFKDALKDQNKGGD